MRKKSIEENENQDKYYFASKGDGRVLAVFRIVARPTGIHELRWTGAGWEPYEHLIRRLVSGDPELDEVSMEVVQKVTPDVDTTEYPN